MSDTAIAQEQSAPTPAPEGRDRFSGLPANELADQLATAMMNNQGKATIDAIQAALNASAAPQAPTPVNPPEAVVPKEQQTEPPATPEPETPVVEKSPEEIAAEATAAEAAAKAAEEEKEPANRVRISHLSEPDKAAQIAINALTKGGMTLREATQRVLGMDKPADPTPEPEPAAIPPEITALEERAADIKTKLRAQAKGEGLLDEAFGELTIELSEVNAKLEATRSRYENAAETQAVVGQATAKQQQEQILQATAKVFPQMTDKTSRQWTLAAELAKAASQPGHPDYETCCSIEAPRFFAQKAAEFLGIKPATAAPSAPPVTPTPSTTSPQTPKPGPAPGSRTSAPVVIQTDQQKVAVVEQHLANVLAGKATAPPKTTPRYVVMG